MPRSKVVHPTPPAPARAVKEASKRGDRPPTRMTRHTSTPKEDEENLDEDVDFEIPDESSVEDSDEYQAPSDVGDESDHRSASKSSQSIHTPDGFDSDALDEEDQDIGLNYHIDSPGKKRAARGKAVKESPDPVTPATSRSVKKRKRADDDESGESEFGEGVIVVGKVIQAPTTGRVTPGRISRNTLNFLNDLTNPRCNDREWFRLHEPVFRLAEKEWVNFIGELIPKVSEMDDEIPPLPPKDVIHRIYRDVRFSNDKTPYKTNFSASMSRSGRKGVFAGYHISIKPIEGSLVAAGLWAPGKNELTTLRSNVLHNPAPLREVISTPEFVKQFGEPAPHPTGARRNIFGHEDELKVAPKGIDRHHPDIDLLKLKSVAVAKRFTDKEVLGPNFIDKVVDIMEVMKPLVHCLNNLITFQDNDSD